MRKQRLRMEISPETHLAIQLWKRQEKIVFSKWLLERAEKELEELALVRLETKLERWNVIETRHCRFTRKEKAFLRGRDIDVPERPEKKPIPAVYDVTKIVQDEV